MVERLGRDRVRPPRELEGILDELKEAGVFETKQKGMMFAAALGFLRRKGEDSELPAMGEGIRLEYFRSPNDEPFIDALAVAEIGDLEVLADERRNERLEIFERYAFLGLQEIKANLAAAPSDATQLETIVEILERAGDEEPGDRVQRLKGLV